MQKKYIYKFSLSSFLLGIMFTISLLGIVREASYWDKGNIIKAIAVSGEGGIKTKLIKSVSAKEIYPEFVCPCCGKPLDPDNICCGAMRERINYIDTLMDKGFSKKEIMKNAVKKFGIESLIDKKKQDNENLSKKQMIAEAPADAPKIIFSKETFDFGKISQKNNVVSTEFKFRNEGETDLVIDSLSASCGCTSASIIYKGKEGPSFTMSMPGHGKKNPKNWSVSIAPGDEAILKVYYDPNAHGPQKKPEKHITRTVSIYSNDPIEFEKKIRIDLDQTP